VHFELEKNTSGDNEFVSVDIFVRLFNVIKVIQSHARQKKWSGHGRTGRTADYGLVHSCITVTLQSANLFATANVIA